ncbi:AAA family ATPase [Rhodovulum sulfidophilum]|uniref:UvrD-helicase domain-containing protein n=1 Tax=Rhodovulum sulfidophilum TaxID=35806 RepID=UPI00192485AB|nr:UvrD-helicase domain-containing protein [Rhodovulum sulfidophilum]MBL3576011.1 AAA family ATPase [Rhodovulum sulfidophilum]MCE8433349.1 AAA family ATPase [Rhodovulum sulfidophilum]MCF4115711.1 AAA family ATPase [Rhodovulum sulfidophilum]
MTQSDDRIVLAAAGSGKTTTAVELACENTEKRTALITYTLNGRSELEARAYRGFGAIPPHVTISSWYSFVLTHFVRPYQNHLHDRRVDTINFERAPITRRRFRKCQISPYFFSSPNRIWSDRATDFACKLIDETNGQPINRIQGVFDLIVVDEAQDLAGWDLELIEYLLQSSVEVALIGDHRQATFSTNDNPKNKKFAGEKIIQKFKGWERSGFVHIEHQSHSYRCVQEICDFADQFFPDCEPTASRNARITGHDGVFLIRQKDVERYFREFAPQTLQWSKAGGEKIGTPLNFGDSKGMTFERVLIYPHKNFRNFLKTGNMDLAGQTKTKTYVAVTRARQSVAIVVPDNFTPKVGTIFQFQG